MSDISGLVIGIVMIGFLGIIGIFVAFVTMIEDEAYKIGSIMLSIIVAVVAVGEVLLGTGVKRKIDSSYNDKICEIASLNREKDLEGHFFLGSGSIKETNYYYYYEITNSGYHLEKIETDYTYIVEDDSITPSIYHTKESGTFKSYYTIYCPVGTIVQEFRG